MKVVIAIDSFKGSLTSLEAAEAVQAGILAAQAGRTDYHKTRGGRRGRNRRRTDAGNGCAENHRPGFRTLQRTGLRFLRLLPGIQALLSSRWRPHQELR